MESVQPKQRVSPTIVESIVAAIDGSWTISGYEAKIGSELGDNFMSIIYSVTISAKCKETGESREIFVIVKTIPKNPIRLASIRLQQMFLKEIQTYQQIFPGFIKFQLESGVPADQVYEPWPRFYSGHYSQSGTEDYVALEDLRKLNFKMGSRHHGLTYDESMAVLRSLGKFHALSYSQFKGNFDLIMATYPFLQEKLWVHPDEMPLPRMEWVRELFSRLATLLRKRNGPKCHLAVAIETIETDTFWHDLYRLASNSTEVAVIGHGDCWTNNSLFKLNPDNTEVIDLKFIDFQQSRASSRCVDLSFFLYTSTAHEVLNEREADLLREYFEAFATIAKRLGYLENKLTFDQLLEEYDAFRLYGLSIGLMMAPVVLAQPGDIPDLENITERNDDNRLSEESKSMWFSHLHKREEIYSRVCHIATHITKLRK